MLLSNPHEGCLSPMLCISIIVHGRISEGVIPLFCYHTVVPQLNDATVTQRSRSTLNTRPVEIYAFCSIISHVRTGMRRVIGPFYVAPGVTFPLSFRPCHVHVLFSPPL